MQRMLIVAPLTALLLTACAVAPGPGSGVAPELPLIVESGAEASLTTGAEPKVVSAVNRISLNLSLH